MSAGLFEVDTYDGDSGELSSTVRVRANTVDGAIRKVAATGVIVGAARLIEVIDSPAVDSWQVEDDRSAAREAQELRNQAGWALALAFLGIFCVWPVSILGAIWGNNLNEKHQRLTGQSIGTATAAVVVGIIVGLLGLVGFVLVLRSDFGF